MRQRAISSVVVVLLTLSPVFFGRYIFAVLIALVIGITLREFNALMRHAGHQPVAWVGYLTVAALLLAAMFERWERWGMLIVALTEGPSSMMGPRELANKMGLIQVRDEGQLDAWCAAAIEAQPQAAADLAAGKEAAIGRLVGHVMKLSGGKVDAKSVQQKLREKVGRG